MHMANKSLAIISAVLASTISHNTLAAQTDINVKLNSSVYGIESDIGTAQTKESAIFTVTPSLSGVVDGKAGDIALNVSHSMVSSSVKDAETSHYSYSNVALKSNLELIENALTFNLEGSQNYRVFNQSEAFLNDSLTSPDSMSKVQRYAAGLKFTLPNPTLFGFTLDTKYSDSSSSRSQNNGSSLDNENFSVLTRVFNNKNFQKLLFDFSLNHQQTVRSGYSDFNSTLASGNVKLEMLDGLRFVLKASDNRYDTEITEANNPRQRIDNTIYGAGFELFSNANRAVEITYNQIEQGEETKNFVGGAVRWAFSPRTSMFIDYGKRFYGDSYSMNFNYKAKSLRSNLTYREDVTTFARFGQSSGNDSAIFVCTIGAEDLSECFQAPGLDYILKPGEEFKSYDDIFSDLSNEVILTKSARYVIGYDKRKLRISFDMGRRETEYLESGRMQKYNSAGLDINYQMSRRTNFELATDFIRRAFDNLTSTEDTYTIRLTANRKLGQNGNFNVGLRYLNRDSANEARDATDKRINLGFNYQF